MATFPSITPAYGVQKTSAPATRTVRFGDGYEQRTSLGLNQNPKVFSLTFNVTETDSDTIETFLDARAQTAQVLTSHRQGRPAALSLFVSHGTRPFHT